MLISGFLLEILYSALIYWQDRAMLESNPSGQYSYAGDSQGIV